jgi:sulfatase modifying factor 1
VPPGEKRSCPSLGASPGQLTKQRQPRRNGAAARCGEDTLYSGSTVIDDVAWYDGNSGNITHTVATLSSNACGLYDMSGNVYEWTQDGYGPYSSGPATDPVGDTDSFYRISRGGTYNNDPKNARIVDRNNDDPGNRYPMNGLRLARTSPSPLSP